MRGLITDRTARNVYYRKELSDKGWNGMTAEERIEWLGDPLEATGANLFPPGPQYSSTVELKYKNEEIVATATVAGTYLYAVSIIGEADKYANKVLTLSAEAIEVVSKGSPMIAMYWHGDDGYDYAGASLLASESVTFDTAQYPNTNNRQYLAAYVYVTTHEAVEVGDRVLFGGVMLENGDTRHEYVPYTEIVPTQATKGAYNYSDLNRVERAVAEISDRYSLGLVTKTNWGMWDIPTESEMARYLDNIVVIRSHLTGDVSATEIPTSMSNLTFEDANNIEKILQAAQGG